MLPDIMLSVCTFNFATNAHHGHDEKMYLAASDRMKDVEAAPWPGTSVCKQANLTKHDVTELPYIQEGNPSAEVWVLANHLPNALTSFARGSTLQVEQPSCRHRGRSSCW